MAKRLLAFILAAVMVFALTACGTGTEVEEPSGGETAGLKPIAKEDVKVGFVYIGDIHDGGYTQAHDKGRLALEAAGYECLYKENIPESADCEVAVRELVDAGCNVIFTTSFGHMDYTETVAKEYPEIYFNHATGYKTLPNMCNYMGRVIEARYLAGIVAGMKTESNKIGYVAAMQIPECIRGINAFTLGVQSVNPDATVEVIWTNTWYDPAVEKQAAIELLDKGCDVIEQHQDSPAPQLAAQEKGKFAIGYNTPTPDAAPKAYLTAPLFYWDKFYVDCVTRITEGTWEPAAYWEGLASGWVGLDELSDLCAEGTAEKVEAAKQGIIDGSLVLFSGEIKDQDGNVKYPNGMTDEEIYNMTWFVNGVIGKIDA
ncbi:MAG: BMP family ABC transporter substrate-binding protein [Oscillospiraceae bacterium]|nr:BMP family ABC transporter substrate-binding protein [Oscillospiraceae bacterium]